MAKTALELTSKEWQEYSLPRRVVTPKVQARFDRAWELIPELAKLLRVEFGATNIKVFGSALHVDDFYLDSDIDLVAWDIPAEGYLQAMLQVDEYSDEFSVDLVNPRLCRPGLRSVIEREGLDV